MSLRNFFFPPKPLYRAIPGLQTAPVRRGQRGKVPEASLHRHGPLRGERWHLWGEDGHFWERDKGGHRPRVWGSTGGWGGWAHNARLWGSDPSSRAALFSGGPAKPWRWKYQILYRGMLWPGSPAATWPLHSSVKACKASQLPGVQLHGHGHPATRSPMPPPSTQLPRSRSRRPSQAGGSLLPGQRGHSSPGPAHGCGRPSTRTLPSPSSPHIWFKAGPWEEVCFLAAPCSKRCFYHKQTHP